MSSETERGRRGSLRRSNEPTIISPEPASDQTAIQNVFGFLQDYVPQAVTGQKEEKRERVLWATFETGDINDVSMEHRRGCDEPLLPLLLVLGLATGYSVWMVSPGGDAQEMYSVQGEGETARVVRLLRTPESCEGVGEDRFADQRPIIAVVKKGRHSSSVVAYSTLHLVSLRKGGDTLVRKISFKTRPIVNIECNRRVVVIVCQKRIVVLDAGTYENRFVIKNAYPSLGYPCNPIALGTRWLAFSETKLISKHQSVGGMSNTTPSSVATTVIKGVKKGFSALTETISGLTGRTQQQSTVSLTETTSQVYPPAAAKPGDKPENEAMCILVLQSFIPFKAMEQLQANVVSIIDVNQAHPQEVRLQDLGRESGVIAHFVAHTGPNVHIASLAFNSSGTLLVTACTEGNTFHVFRILPHPWLSSETAVHHLYTLYRGATTGLVQDISVSNDSRWVAVSTLNGTTHVFPTSPYGGDVTVRTHTSKHVVNQLSRFHTSAGIETVPSHPHHSHSQSQPPPHVDTNRDLPPVASYGSSLGNWCHPRALPLPSPVTVSALQQIKQPYLSGDGTGKGSTPSGGVSPPHLRGESSEPFVTLAGPDAICVKVMFALLPPSGRRASTDSPHHGATYTLYVIGSNGVLTEHVLEPRGAPGTQEEEDAPIELTHHSKLCWRLLSKSPSGTMSLPLPDHNPLLVANSEYRKFLERAKNAKGSTTTKTDGEWLSQVEILTHAPPSRRLWMGPQFSFKAYQLPASSPSNPVSALLKTPSPPHTVIFSGSLTSNTPPVGTSGGVQNKDLMSEFLSLGSGEGVRGKSDTQGSQEDEGEGVMHSPAPLIDLLSGPPDHPNLRTTHTSPMAMPVLTGDAGMESGPTSMEPGTVEVFGSWNKIAPRIDGSILETDVEKQLAEAIGEPERPTVTVMSSSSGARTGFHPPGESH